MFSSIKKFFSKEEKQKTNQIKRSALGRSITLEKGDTCLILKADNRSLFIDSGEKEFTRGDELLMMCWCYLRNQEFVNILYALFDEVLDEIKQEKMNTKGSMVKESKVESEQ